MEKRIQELWRAVAVEVQALRGSVTQKENSVDSLSQEVLESKKFLWEELEAVQAELRRIHQKLKDQDVDITRNLVRIKKVRESQVKCIKFLAQLKGRVSGDASEAIDSEAGHDKGSDDIWSPINSPQGSSSLGDRREPLRVKTRGSHQQQQRKGRGGPPTSYLSDSALQ